MKILSLLCCLSLSWVAIRPLEFKVFESYSGSFPLPPINTGSAEAAALHRLHLQDFLDQLGRILADYEENDSSYLYFFNRLHEECPALGWESLVKADLSRLIYLRHDLAVQARLLDANSGGQRLLAHAIFGLSFWISEHACGEDVKALLAPLARGLYTQRSPKGLLLSCFMISSSLNKLYRAAAAATNDDGLSDWWLVKRFLVITFAHLRLLYLTILTFQGDGQVWDTFGLDQLHFSGEIIFMPCRAKLLSLCIDEMYRRGHFSGNSSSKAILQVIRATHTDISRLAGGALPKLPLVLDVLLSLRRSNPAFERNPIMKGIYRAIGNSRKVQMTGNLGRRNKGCMKNRKIKKTMEDDGNNSSDEELAEPICEQSALNNLDNSNEEPIEGADNINEEPIEGVDNKEPIGVASNLDNCQLSIETEEPETEEPKADVIDEQIDLLMTPLSSDQMQDLLAISQGCLRHVLVPILEASGSYTSLAELSENADQVNTTNPTIPITTFPVTTIRSCIQVVGIRNVAAHPTDLEVGQLASDAYLISANHPEMRTDRIRRMLLQTASPSSYHQQPANEDVLAVIRLGEYCRRVRRSRRLQADPGLQEECWWVRQLRNQIAHPLLGWDEVVEASQRMHRSTGSPLFTKIIL